MIIIKEIIILLILIVVLPLKASAVTDNHQIIIRGESHIEFPATNKHDGFVIDIWKNGAYSEDAFPEDYFVLHMYSLDKEGRRNVDLGSIDFSSSYGEFKLQLFDLTGDGIEEFILIRGEGRGTSARKEYLEITSVPTFNQTITAVYS